MKLDQGDNIKVSVIITTFNREEFLKETIESILSQTIKPYEIIIVDNYSNYPIVEVFSNIDPSIKVFRNENKGIIAVNRNFGIKKASGNYLAFCDDDDLWEVSKLEKQINLLEKSNCDLVSSNIQEFEGSTMGGVSNYKPIQKISNLITRNQICLSSVLVKNSKEVIFNTSYCLLGIEDYELWIRLVLHGYQFGLIKEPLVRYRVSNFSTSEKKRLVIEENKIQYFKSIGLKLLINGYLMSSFIILGRSIKSFLRIQIIKIKQ